MNRPDSNAAVLWTGGKDSSLALYEAHLSGYCVRSLVTFAPTEPNFLAHPLAFMTMQAEALAVPHHVWPVGEPFGESYQTGLRWLKDTLGIETVITGDIAEVGGSPNWIRERSRPVGMNVLTPLWGQERLALLQRLLSTGLKAVFSCIKTRWLTDAWVGRELDQAAIADLRALREQNGLDLCGEEGEYHTLVTDSPLFKQQIRIRAYAKRSRDSLVYMDIHDLELAPK